MIENPLPEYRDYLVSYRHEGSEWNITLPARSYDDAQRRLSQLAFAKIDGVVVANVPAALGPIAALITFVANTFRRRSAA